MDRKIGRLTFWVVVAMLGMDFQGSLWAREKGLRIYGPEDLSAPMKECAGMFSKKYGIEAQVLSGPEGTWIAGAKQEADVIYEGSEYMLTRFIANHS